MAVYTIGQLSKLTQCKIPTIRYYEKIKLLPQASRTQGNQRRYNQEQVKRLQFIRHSRALGFNIEEIRQLIHLQTCVNHSPHQAHQVAQQHLADVRQKISQLQALAEELQNLINCPQGDPYHCQVLDVLNEQHKK